MKITELLNESQQGVAEGSNQYLVYISKSKVREFEEWMESEGLETEVPKKDVGEFIVYDYSGQDVITKSYADDWNEKGQGVMEGNAAFGDRGKPGLHRDVSHDSLDPKYAAMTRFTPADRIKRRLGHDEYGDIRARQGAPRSLDYSKKPNLPEQGAAGNQQPVRPTNPPQPVKKKPMTPFGKQKVDEKAVSKAQQRFMGMAHSIQKGKKIPGASKELKDVAKGMSKKAGHEFAATKHKGLPEKVKKKD